MRTLCALMGLLAGMQVHAAASRVPEWELVDDDDRSSAQGMVEETVFRTSRLNFPIDQPIQRFRPSMATAGAFRFRWRIGTAGLAPCCEVVIHGHTYTESESQIYRWSPFFVEDDEVVVKVIHPNSTAVFQIELIDAFPKSTHSTAGASLLGTLQRSGEQGAPVGSAAVRVGAAGADGRVAWCGGTLFDGHRVLTAAHCVRKPDGLFVLSGDGTLSDHVQVTSVDPYGDTALILTEEAFHAAPIALTPGSVVEGQRVRATARIPLAGKASSCFVTPQNTAEAVLAHDEPIARCPSASAAIRIALDPGQRIAPGASGSGVWADVDGKARLLGVVSGHPRNDTASLLMARVPATFFASNSLEALGKKLFFEPALSASGRQSCASCHDPASAHAPGNALAVQLGGATGTVPGFRAVPSLRYLALVPAVTSSISGEDEDEVRGLNWDGSAPSLVEQARKPLIASHEMANETPAAVVEKLRRLPYAGEFEALFGAEVLAQENLAFFAARVALAEYQGTKVFRPFTSKFDRYVAGKAALSTTERRGLAVFNDPKRGNCASCHLSAKQADGTPPLFADGGFDALGVPRNPAIPANADPGYFDLGLCGEDAGNHPEWCGRFRTPTLRNVATRKVFYHNGVMNNLRDAVAFYATRDTQAKRWFPAVDGEARRFNDLPQAYAGNVDTSKAPFKTNGGKGSLLSESDIDDVVAFLGTLTDADQVANSMAYRAD